jgi:hypothetical protein
MACSNTSARREHKNGSGRSGIHGTVDTRLKMKDISKISL